jgi:hypothetical protein
MDAAIATLRQQMGDKAGVIRLTGKYQNLNPYLGGYLKFRIKKWLSILWD